jgi:HEAT repeat protein
MLLAVLLAVAAALLVWRWPDPSANDEKGLPNPLVQGIALSAWMQKALSHDDYWQYVRELNPVAADAAPYLSQALRHKDNLFNSAYVQIWPKIPAAIQRHLHQPILARDVRLRAVVLLREIGNPAKAAIPDLIKCLSDSDGTVRVHAAIALGNMGPDAKSALPFLEPFLRNPSQNIRVYTAAAVWNISKQPEPSLSILEAGLLQTNATDRWAAATFLGEMGPAARPAIPLLAQAIHDSDKAVASFSAQALAEIGEDSLPFLTNLLTDPDPAMRISAIVALGKFGPKAILAAPLLTNLLSDNATGSPSIMRRAFAKPERVGDAAAEALSRITRKDDQP